MPPRKAEVVAGQRTRGPSPGPTREPRTLSKDDYFTSAEVRRRIEYSVYMLLGFRGVMVIVYRSVRGTIKGVHRPQCKR